MGLYEGIKDVARVLQQADNIDLYTKLLDLGAQALEMQNEISRLNSENAKLKEGKSIEAKIVRHSSPYITLVDEPNDRCYCATCWGNDHKLIQMYVSGANKTFHFQCCSCKTAFYSNIER